MNSAQKKSGSGEDRSRGFRSSSLNASELQRPDWAIAVRPSVVVNCPSCGALIVARDMPPADEPVIGVVCPRCGSAGRLLIEHPAGTTADARPADASLAEDAAPVSAPERSSGDPVVAPPISPELSQAAAQAATDHRRFTDSTERHTIGDWCRLDAGIAALWQSLDPNHGSGLQVSSVARDLGLTGPTQHRSHLSERKPLYSRVELTACLAVLQQQSQAQAATPAPMPVAIEPDAAGLGTTRVQQELRLEAS